MIDKLDTTWKLFIAYVLVLACMLASNIAFGQIHVSQFNADVEQSKWSCLGSRFKRV